MLPLFAVLFLCWAFWRDWRSSRLELFPFLVLRVALVYSRLWHRWQSNRPAPFPRGGGCLIVSNHTCSADPMFLLAGCAFPIGFGVAREHFNLHWFANWVLVGIGSVPIRRGGNDPAAVRGILRALRAGRNVCLFPEGNLSGVARGRFGPARLGAAYLALKSRAPLYPAYIAGGPRTDRLLPSWLLPTPKAVKVVYGPSMDLSAYHNRPLTRKLMEEVTALIMKRIESLNVSAKPQG